MKPTIAISNEYVESWKKEGAFERSIALREGAPEFIAATFPRRLSMRRECFRSVSAARNVQMTVTVRPG